MAFGLGPRFLALARLHFILDCRQLLQAAGQPLGIHSFFDLAHCRQGGESGTMPTSSISFLRLTRFADGSVSSAEVSSLSLQLSLQMEISRVHFSWVFLSHRGPA